MCSQGGFHDFLSPDDSIGAGRRGDPFSGGEYFQEIVSLLESEAKQETEQFISAFQEYFNAVAHQHKGHPRDRGLTH